MTDPAPVDYGHEPREFQTYTSAADGDKPEVSIQAHVVTKETTVDVVGLGPRVVSPGDILVATGNPNRFDVMSKADLEGSSFKLAKGETEPEAPDDFGTAESHDDDVRDTDYDPGEYTAAEVRNYLLSLDPNSEEYTRVIAAEKAGANRKSALP